MTLATQAVLKVFLEDLSASRYGFDIAREAGLATGSLYPILARLEQAGWVESFWEDQESTELGRPRRRYYRLTDDGACQARSALEATLRRTTPRSWLPARGALG
ncbi:helix-turn-helix transcriptional regulator [Planomonospora sp. ID91781]|uniref:PadR family transcriptional regulator n=1 Tax=Planomonospora sp. ID91781 TaxID=2738135 RepID=UPI0018C36495|nr:helix-turn-helix transcriptional regulator [Planomonospora sp. ID91781]